ncbi:hypothetical protein B0H17DRAFT_1033677, partial [Mycena rosella]
MEELNLPSTRDQSDALFLERLDAFCLAEMKAFAEREHRPLEETRQYVAEWHSNRMDRVKAVLSDASRILESLCDASGVQSFLLAVDPSDTAGSGFLGGSVLGREYYRGQRGGGDAGAKAFKVHCLKNVAPTAVSANAEASSSTSTTPKISAARSVKADLYEGVRKALRSASGVRNAEMKWTNPALLSIYGVCLNPSSLKSSQNKELLRRLKVERCNCTHSDDANEPPVESPAPVTSGRKIYDEPAASVSSATGSSEWDGGIRPKKRAREDDMYPLQ